MVQKHFNKRIFALLIQKAKAGRTTQQFAKDCGISYVQLHKLENCAQQNPPGLKLIEKLAENSPGTVGLEEYLFASGHDIADDKKEKSTAKFDIQSLYEKLSHGQQKTVYDFIDYLLNYKQ